MTRWDEELEEGDTILMISFEEAIHIRAMWHIAMTWQPRPMQRRRLKCSKKWFLNDAETSKIYSIKKTLMNSQNLNHGTTPLNLSQTPMPTLTARFTCLIEQNKRNWTSSLMRTCLVEGYAHPNHLWHHCSSSSKEGWKIETCPRLLKA